MNEFIVSHTASFVYLLGGLLLLCLIFLITLTIFFMRMKRKLQLFLTGSNAKNLESTILNQIHHSQKVSKDLEELYAFNKKIYELAHKGLYKVGFVRFNPFKDVGGDQSFAVALLDGKRNGIVLSSLYTKESSRLYAKPIQDGLGLPQYPLTDEEKEAVSTAHSQKSISPNT